MSFYNFFYNSQQSFKKRISQILVFGYVKIYLIFIVVFNVILWMLASLISAKVDQDLLVLHYNVDFGIDLIGSPYKIFIIPALSLIISIFNFSLLFIFIKSKDFKFICHFLLASCILVDIFLLMSIASIYLINFR